MTGQGCWFLAALGVSEKQFMKTEILNIGNGLRLCLRHTGPPLVLELADGRRTHGLALVKLS